MSLHQCLNNRRTEETALQQRVCWRGV
ncbi:hypothetical protein LINGRAHAP2_LOCUS11008 [Linum grandiflorum]